MSETTTDNHTESLLEEGLEKSETKSPQLVSSFWLALIGATNLGLGAAWALLFALATPYFETALQSGPVLSHAVWLAGPMAGLVIAPLVGHVTDASKSPYESRRFFIAIGSLMAAVTLVLFANSRMLARSLFVTAWQWGAGIALAILAFALTIASLNTSQWPARGLMGDLVPPAQQHALQARLVVAISLADLAVNAMIHAFAEPVAHVRFIFYAGATLFLVSKGMLLLLASKMRARTASFDTDWNAESLETESSLETGVGSRGWVAYLREMPRWMWHVGLTATTGGFMMFCTRPSASSWVASSVLNGDPTAAAGTPSALLYESGVRAYGRASQRRALLQIAYSLVYPRLIAMGIPPSYLVGISHAVCATILLAFCRTTDVTVAEWVIVSLALPTVSLLAAINSVIVAQSPARRRGINLGIINVFTVFSHMVDTAYTGFVSRAFGESAVMMIGAFWGLATAFVAFAFEW